MEDLKFKEQYQVVCHSLNIEPYLILNKNGGRYYKTLEKAKLAIEKHKRTKLNGFTSCNGIGIEFERDNEYIKKLKAEKYSIEKRYITEWEEVESNI